MSSNLLVTNGATPNDDTTSSSPASQKAKLGMAAYRAPSLLQPHRLREAIADAHAGRIPPLIGYVCGLSSVAIGRVAAQLNFDVVWIDWEHSSMNVETMTQMVHDVQFMSEGKSAAMVRVPGHDHAAIGYALDAGASICIPQVDTVEQAQHVISAAKYGGSIKGTRSAPPMRLIPGVSDIPMDQTKTFMHNVNQQAAIIIQIESFQGIKNLDAILTAVGDHIDSVWLGSLDCRVSMGFEAGGLWGQEKEWLDAVALYESTLKKHNKPASGLVLGDPEAKARMARGRSLMFTTADMYSLLMEGFRDLQEMRGPSYPAMDYSKVYKKL